TFDPGRNAGAHLALGRGIHFCLGAMLARVEGEVVLNIMFDRYKTLSTIPDDPPEFLPAILLTGLRKLPVSLG
ncbi:cytochrome P450, partial [Actinoplanes sp. NPDC051633]